MTQVLQPAEHSALPTDSGNHYSNITVVLDGRRYENCTFHRCTLVFQGGYFELDGNRITECAWKFEGAAAATIALLQDLYQTGARSTVEGVINLIRGAAHTDPETGAVHPGHRT